MALWSVMQNLFGIRMKFIYFYMGCLYGGQVQSLFGISIKETHLLEP
jgi:hypothetical protein